MKSIKIMKSMAEMGKRSAVKQASGIGCRTFIYQPKVPARLLEIKK